MKLDNSTLSIGINDCPNYSQAVGKNGIYNISSYPDLHKILSLLKNHKILINDVSDGYGKGSKVSDANIKPTLPSIIHDPNKKYLESSLIPNTGICFVNNQGEIIKSYFDNVPYILSIYEIPQTAANNQGTIRFRFSICARYKNTKCNNIFIDTVNNELAQYGISGWRATSIEVEDDNRLMFYLYTIGNIQSNPKSKSQTENKTLQQIFYGAPGTGKSFSIVEDFPLTKDNTFRTTFHPDTDYASFVGCYKPINTDALQNNGINKTLSLSELQNLYNDFISQTPRPTSPEITFAGMYYYALNNIAKKDWPLIFNGSTASIVNTEVPRAITAAKSLASRIIKQTSRISYEFNSQVFIDAYIEAWRRYVTPAVGDTDNSMNVSEDIYLIIEEINRGNCAQIFGDIFQLLDRNDLGYSEYEIKPDKDIEKYIRENGGLNVSGITNKKGDDISKDINNGKLLKLPNNLYIIATMNTSDQSLFPMDSAFKRRWDWVYVPINTKEENWAIDINGTLYSWNSFLKIINDKIFAKTDSEDKQLGYYFCKAEDEIISAQKFVSKVLFYLYNDVFKDYGFDDEIFKDGEEILSFRKYYISKNEIDEIKVEKFLNNLDIDEFEETPSIASTNTKKHTYKFDGVIYKAMSKLGTAIINKYLDANPNLTFQDIKQTFSDSWLDAIPEPKVAIEYSQISTLKSRVRYYTQEPRTSNDNIDFVLYKQWGNPTIGHVIDFAKQQGWEVEQLD